MWIFDYAKFRVSGSSQLWFYRSGHFLLIDTPNLGSSKPFLMDYFMRVQNFPVVQSSLTIKSMLASFQRFYFTLLQCFFIALFCNGSMSGLFWDYWQLSAALKLAEQFVMPVLYQRNGILRWPVCSTVTILYLNSQRCLFTKKKEKIRTFKFRILFAHLRHIYR